MADAAQFAVDIAARMSGAEQTTAQLDGLTKQLTGGGARAEHFERAIAQIAEKLDASKAAASGAQSALAAGASEYEALEAAAAQAAVAVEMFDRDMARAAKSAASAAAASASVEEMRGRLDAMRSASDASAAAVAEGKARLAEFGAAAKLAAQEATIAARANAGVVPPELAERAAAAARQVAVESTALDGLRAAASAAKGELSAGSKELAALEAAAAKAARAASDAQRKVEGLSRGELEAASGQAASALAQQSGEMKRLEEAAKRASAEQEGLARTSQNLGKLQRHVNDRLGAATTKLSTFRGALGDVGGPLGELGERALFPAQAFVDLNEKFGATAAFSVVAVVGIAAVAAAVVALSAALVVGVGAIAAWAVKLADAGRSARLAQEAFEALHPEIAGISSAFAEVEGATGQGADALRKLSTSLRDAKVSAADLPIALRAAALAETALGAGGAAAFIEDMKAGKLSVQEFANTAEQKFGGIVAKRMLGLEAQGARLKRNFASIFGGLDIDPALSGLETLVALFDENTASGRALKFLFDTVFQPLIDQAQNAAYVVEAFALGFLIGLTKLYIGIKPVLAAIGEIFGFEDTSLADTLDIAKKAGEWFAAVFAAGAIVLGVVTAAIIAVVAVLVGIQVAISAAIGAFARLAGELTANVVKAIMSVVDYIANTPWAQIGSDIIGGLVGGLKSAGGAVLSTITGIVGGAVSKAKALLGIHSPSTVFASIGEDTGEGFVVGVDDKQGDAQAAVADLVAPPAPPSIEVPAVEASAAPSNDVAAQAAPWENASLEGAFAPVLPALPEAPAPANDVAAQVAPPDFAGLDLGGALARAIHPASEPVFPSALLTPPPMPEAPQVPQGPLASYDALSGNLGSVAQAQPVTNNTDSSTTTTTSSKSSVNFAGATFNFYGVEGAEDAEERFEEALTRALEGDASKMAGERAA